MKEFLTRRRFIKKALMGLCGFALGMKAVKDILTHPSGSELQVGFRNDASAPLWKFSREADFYSVSGGMVRCELCPHECVLGENDRGFCRTRAVKNGKLFTLAYGNPCSVHVDPVEKKPLYHFLPGTPIMSVATAGCNLRCLNCQNWEISQKRPEDTRNFELSPARLVEVTAQKKIPLIAYTYSEPLIFYEYVRDSSVIAREKGLRNVLVSAGYALEAPLRQIARVTEAANIDLKGFNDAFYKKISGAKLAPVMRALEIMLEENVWLEVTRLIIPTISDDLDDIRRMCRWMARNLGPDVPLHFSRFHGDYKLKHIPMTPVETLTQAREIAQAEGLRHVYIGNVPGFEKQQTLCPRCGEVAIDRAGFKILLNRLKNGRCPCGEKIAGVWS